MPNYKKSRKRKRKKHNKTRKKGGFFKHLTDEIVTLWENPHESSTPMDCCPCVFSLLGMPKKTVDYLRYNNPNGFSKQKIEDGFNEGYPEFTFEFQKSDNILARGRDMFNAYLMSIWETIPKNYATVGGYERKDGTKHCIVLAKNNVGEAIILDAQTGLGYSGIPNIANHLLTHSPGNPVKFMYHLVSQKKKAATKQPLILNKEGQKIMSSNEEKSAVSSLSAQLESIDLGASSQGASKMVVDDEPAVIPMDIDDDNA